MASYYAVKQTAGKWYCKVKWKDFSGKDRQTTLRGFTRKSDALEAGKNFLDKQKGSPDMTFGTLAEAYLDDKKKRCKEVTWYDKRSRLQTWALPYLKDLPANDIEPGVIRDWQNTLLTSTNKKGTLLSPGYIQNIVAEVSGVFNYGVAFKGIKSNPVKEAGNPGKKQKSITFWTPEEFQTFISTFDASDPYYAGFMVLYYTGMRKGEMLALTPPDIDLEAGLIHISKTFKVLQGEKLITTPKTEKANRTITIPPFLCEVIRKHEASIYGLTDKDRVFTFSDTRLGATLDNHIKQTNIKRIKVHDLRHSHASLLIDMGFSAILISERLGHEDVSVTLNTYAHLFPSKQSEVAEKLQARFGKK